MTAERRKAKQEAIEQLNKKGQIADGLIFTTMILTAIAAFIISIVT